MPHYDNAARTRTTDTAAAKSTGSGADAAEPTTVIGVDIGGTGIKGGIVNMANGKVIGDRYRLSTPQPSTPEAVARCVKDIVDELSKRDMAPASGSPVGVTFPAIISHGIARSAANVDKSWIDTDVDTLFSTILERKVEVMNDADAAGLAEARFGAGRGVDGVVLVITLGTGIGSAFIMDGLLVPNAELGHLELDGYDAETRASATARERDGLSWDEYGVRLQRYFSHLQFIFSPELFIIGGGISKRSEDFLPLLDLRPPVLPAKLKNNAGIVGAALHSAERFKHI